MKIEELLATTPECLAARQYQSLQKHVKHTLLDVISEMEKGNLQTLYESLCCSPAGDCMGTDNSFIGFGELFHTGYDADIGDCIEKLIELNKIRT